MNIKVNGKAISTSAETIQKLLDELDIAPQNRVVEKNGVIVPYINYKSVSLDEADIIEIINFVGGG